MTEQSPEPLSLERARLLLGWLRSQRAVDNCLSELLAAGPAGERRVSHEIDRVSSLVAAANSAFEAYRQSVGRPAGHQDAAVASEPAEPRRSVMADLRTIDVGSVSPLTR